MLTALAFLGVAHGQQAAPPGGFDAHGFRLAAHDGDLRDPLVLQRPGSLVPGDWFLSGLVEYAKSPLVQVVVPEGGGPGEVAPLVDNLLATNLSAGVALHERVRLDLGAPVYFLTTDQALQAQPPAMGDLRVGGTLLAVAPAHVVGGGGPGLGLFAHLDVPTGNTDRFLGQGGLGGSIGLAGTVELATTTLTAQVGTQFNPSLDLANVEGSDRLLAGLAANFLTSDTFAVTIEGVAQPSLSAADPNAPFRTLPPAEALLSMRVLPANGSFWTIGAAGGLTDAPGVAAFRLFVGGGFADRTPLDPIDHDTIGALRTTDLCPLEPETVNDWRDDDGCPDRLGALTIEARYGGEMRVGAEAEVVGPSGRQEVTLGPTGYQVDAVPGSSFQVRAYDGCLQGEGSVVVGEGGAVLSVPLAPLLDAKVLLEVVNTDETPIPGATARWVSDHAECVPTAVGTTDEKGLLAQEIAAGKHKVVVTAEAHNVAEQEVELLKGDDKVVRIHLGASKIVVEKKQIRILEKVQFETAKAVIRPESFGLLDEVASVILDNPQLGRVEVAGHTDDRGSDTYNQKLSEDRARSVATYLSGRGVAPARLVAVGYGETKPIATNKTDSGRETNRRVEFNLIDQQEEATP